MSTTLLDLARKLDGLDPEAAWEQRIVLGEQVKKILGDKADEFARRHEEVVLRPVEFVLRQMGLFDPPKAQASERPGAPAAAPRPGPSQEPGTAQEPPEPPLSEADRLKAAAATYRRFRTLSNQAQVSEDDLKTASVAWTAGRDAFPEGTEGRGKLDKETTRINQGINAERDRPKQHPNQLAGVRFVPAAAKSKPEAKR